MPGIKVGLQAFMLEKVPRAQYVHCTAHLVNLVVHYIAQNIPACRNSHSWVDNPDQKFTKNGSPGSKNFKVKKHHLRGLCVQMKKVMQGGKASGLLVHLQKFWIFFSLKLTLLLTYSTSSLAWKQSTLLSKSVSYTYRARGKRLTHSKVTWRLLGKDSLNFGETLLQQTCVWKSRFCPDQEKFPADWKTQVHRHTAFRHQRNCANNSTSRLWQI